MKISVAQLNYHIGNFARNKDLIMQRNQESESKRLGSGCFF